MLTSRRRPVSHTPVGREGRRVANRAYPHVTSVAGHHVATPIHRHRTDKPPLIVHSDDSPHRCHSLTRDRTQSQRSCPDSVQPRIVSRLRATRILFSLATGWRPLISSLTR